MPANFDDGFFVRYGAWHGLGKVVDEYPGDWKTARKLAGLMWEPLEAPVFEFVGKNEKGRITYSPETAVDGRYQVLEGRIRVVRSDNGRTLGVPSATYAIITHAEIGEIIEALNKEPNIKYETTVCLEDGAAGACVIRLDEPIRLPRDNSYTLPYLALTWRHDGSGSVRAQSTTVRIVCGNTFAAAETEANRNGTVFTFRHTQNWRDHVEEAQETIRGLRADFTEYVDFARHLVRIKVNKEQTATFLAQFIPAPLTSVAASDTVMRNIEEARLTVKAILDSDTCATINGTAFGLVQASAEYLDHYRDARNPETYMRRQLWRPEVRKVEAVKLVRKLVGA